MQRDFARMLRLVPRSRKGQGRKNESGLILLSHAIAPSHDDVRGPSPDDGRTTMHDHARRGLRHSRRHRRATGDIPPPIRDDGSKPIRDDFHATSARRAIHDARPNRRNDHSDPHKLPPARRRTAQSERHRREMFEVSLLIPPSKRAMLGGEIPHVINTMHSQCQFHRRRKPRNFRNLRLDELRFTNSPQQNFQTAGIALRWSLRLTKV